MATLKQQPQVLEGISPYSSSRRSSRIAAIDEDIHDHQGQEIGPYPSSTNSSGGRSKRISPDDLEDNSPPPTNLHQNQKSGWRTFLSFVGPGFLISISYIDPGNLETGMQAGANYGYELLWVILIGFIFAFIIQSLAANLGICTGKHLSELCKLEYPKYVKIALWLLAEIAVIAADLIEVIGTAFALNILIHVPVWAGVIMTGGSTLLLLGLQKYGVRKLEISIEVIQFALAGYFFAEMGFVKPPAKDVMKGLFVPKLSGQGAIANAIALIGATVTPYNLFLHSGIVLSRKVPDSVSGINDACRYLVIESGFAFFVALLINISIVSVTSGICKGHNLTNDEADKCNNLTLDSASFLLKNVLGKSSSLVYGIALLASGQSTTLTSTYAGQFIMQGFLDLRMKKWISNLITRCTAIMPSLIAAIVGGSSGAGRLIIIASMILSFELPFALIPLIKFSSSTAKMGPHKNSIYIIVISWILAVLLIGINVYYLSTAFVDWLIHNHLPKIGKVFIGIVVFPLMAIYILAIIYLAIRKDTVVTYTETKESDPNDLAKMESGQVKSGSLDQVPYREDLADVPFPE